MKHSVLIALLGSKLCIDAYRLEKVGGIPSENLIQSENFELNQFNQKKFERQNINQLDSADDEITKKVTKSHAAAHFPGVTFVQTSQETELVQLEDMGDLADDTTNVETASEETPTPADDATAVQADAATTAPTEAAQPAAEPAAPEQAAAQTTEVQAAPAQEAAAAPVAEAQPAAPAKELPVTATGAIDTSGMDEVQATRIRMAELQAKMDADLQAVEDKRAAQTKAFKVQCNDPSCQLQGLINAKNSLHAISTAFKSKPNEEKIKTMAKALGIPFTPDLMQIGDNEAISGALMQIALTNGKTESEIATALGA